MKKTKTIKQLIVGLMILATIPTSAQIASGSSFGANGQDVIVHGTDTVSIWSNHSNEDSAGVKQNGVIVFYGSIWNNQINSILDSEGSLIFKNPRPAPYADTTSQVIDNSGVESSYPCLVIDNLKNVVLNNHTIVRDTLIFRNGKIMVEANNLTIQNTHADAIQGYDENKYAVVGGGTTGGYLVRNGVGADARDFPVGTSTSSYTPASIANSGILDTFSVRVFDKVFENGTSGTDLSSESVGKTWDIKEATAGGSNATISLQHNTVDEGANFPASAHFVTHYIGTAPNTAGDTTSLTQWDLVFTANLGSGSTTGTITTGSPIANAVVTTRSGFTSFSPFSKSGNTNASPVPIKLLDFDAEWLENDGLITWSTANEINNSHFILSRSFDGHSFVEIATIPSKAPNGTSNSILEYDFIDGTIPSSQDKVFYTLTQVDYSEREESYGPVDLKRSSIDNINVFPNPSRGLLTVSTEISDILSIEILTMYGQTVHSFDNISKNKTVMNLSHLERASYILKITNDNNTVVKHIVLQ